ncbi:unnamed protein product, partial [Caenorhabditis auriculariae]
SGILDGFENSLNVIRHKGVIVAILMGLAALIICILLDVVRSQADPRARCSLTSASLWSILLLTSAMMTFFAGAIAVVFIRRFDASVAKLLIPKYLSYLKKSSSRKFIDRIQATYSCCGVLGIDDFLDFSEVEVPSFRNTLKPNTKFGDCSNLPCELPLSCCSSMSCSNQLMLLKEPEGAEGLVESWYHQTGCIEALDKHYLWSPLPCSWLTAVLISIFFLLQLLGAVSMQMTLTGFATLNESGREEDEDSYAWILPCAYPSPQQLVEKLMPESSSENEDEVPRIEQEGSTEVKSKSKETKTKEQVKKVELKNTGLSKVEEKKGPQKKKIKDEAKTRIEPKPVGKKSESKGIVSRPVPKKD